MKPTLLVLAAGMGSRYGGLKQVDQVGPSGETIIDYSVYDAIREDLGRSYSSSARKSKQHLRKLSGINSQTRLRSSMFIKNWICCLKAFLYLKDVSNLGGLPMP
ncbi:MAG: hypothetical protein AAFY70_13270 [Bacteroidota bacterium]